MAGSSSGKRGALEAASLVFRIATVGLSLASAIMTATSTQCLYDADGRPAVTVSYADYPSFKYSAVADLLSAALQGVAIFLEVGGKEKAAKTVKLIDKIVQALTSTSAALLLAVDDITSCGGPTRGGGARLRGSACGQAGGFCGRVRASSAFSLAAAVSVSASIYIRRVTAPVALMAAPPPTRRTAAPVSVPPRRPDSPPPPTPTTKPTDPEKIKKVPPPKQPPSSPPPRDNGGGGGKGGGAQEPGPDHCPPTAPTGSGCVCGDLAPAMPQPWCRCPRLKIPCGCENPDLCGAFF